MVILTIQPSIFVLKIAPVGAPQSVTKVAKKATHPAVLKRLCIRNTKLSEWVNFIHRFKMGGPPVLAGVIGELCSGPSSVGNKRATELHERFLAFGDAAPAPLPALRAHRDVLSVS
jgi:hypothetical protein